MPLEKARGHLGLVWFGGSALMVVIFAIQSLYGVYEDKVTEVWGWLLPNVMPTLSLMLGVFGSTAIVQSAERSEITVRVSFYRLAIAMSVLHFAFIVAVTVVYMLQFQQPELDSEFNPLRPFNVSNLWLGPMQGLVAATISTLFFSERSKFPQA